MSEGRFEGLLKAISGFEMHVADWRGTAKVDQDKPRGGAQPDRRRPCGAGRTGYGGDDEDEGPVMTPQDDEALWRNRFIAINLVRIGGTAVVLVGLAIWHSDLVVEGGTLVLGLPLALAGLVISFWGPKWLASRWRTPPGP